MFNRHGRRVDPASPGHEVFLHPFGAVTDDRDAAGPDGVLFEVPGQFPSFDGTDGGDETPALRTGHLALPRRGGLIDEPRTGGGAADAVLLMEFEVGEFEDEFFQRFGL